MHGSERGKTARRPHGGGAAQDGLRRPADAPHPGRSRPTWVWLVLMAWVLLFLIAHLVGCGYTVLEQPGGGAAPPADPARSPRLPPGHPPIDGPDTPQIAEWVGRSLLDDIVGESDPLRFENVRRQHGMRLPDQHARITLRMSSGGPAAADVRQLRIDEHGWVTVTRWTQSQAGPVLDESDALERAEFRLEPESEAALRTMLLAMMPIAGGQTRKLPEIRWRDIPIESWTFDESGMLELEYYIETLGGLTQEDWPRGKAVAPLDAVQLLIGTWDSVPPRELRERVRAAASSHPLLVDLAMLVEGLVLAWEVEGPARGGPDLPLHVGR